MIFMNVQSDDLLAANVLNEQELAWLDKLRIPLNDVGDDWNEKRRIDSLVAKAIADGLVKEIQRAPVVRQRAAYVISDDLGTSGVLNHADGKVYDSKSEYYKAVKAAGCVIVGNDAPTDAKGPTHEINERELCHDIKEAIQQLGG